MDLHFDCVFYYVHDLEAAIHFYTEVLGLNLSSRDAVARLSIDEMLVELVPAPKGLKTSGRGNARLCLNVSDIESAVSELRAKNVDVGQIQDVSNGRLAAFRDPDGNELVLWQHTPMGEQRRSK